MDQPLASPDLPAAAAALDLAQAVVGSGVRALATTGGPDVQQVLAYDVAHAAAAVECVCTIPPTSGRCR